MTPTSEMSDRLQLLRWEVACINMDIWSAEAELGRPLSQCRNRSSSNPPLPLPESVNGEDLRVSNADSASDGATPERMQDAAADWRAKNWVEDKPSVQRRLAVERARSREQLDDLLNSIPSCPIPIPSNSSHLQPQTAKGGAQAMTTVAPATSSPAVSTAPLTTSSAARPATYDTFPTAWECFLEGLCGLRGLLNDLQRQRLSGIQFAPSPHVSFAARQWTS